MAAAFHMAMGIDRILQAVGAVDQRPDRARLDQRPEPVAQGPCDPGLGQIGLRALRPIWGRW